MANSATYIPTAEAAFIAGLSDRDMNRVMDERIVPDSLFRSEKGRQFARLAAGFARFYFGTEGQFAASLRKQIVGELTIRVEHSRQKLSIFSMDNVAKDFDWTVTVPHARIDVSAFIHDAIECVHQVEKADSLVHIDSAIMNGMPVFWGTRVPIDTITASLDKGIDKERLISSYPFLTDEHIEAARTYAKVHPKRGRPRRLSEANPTWEVKSVRVVRATKA